MIKAPLFFLLLCGASCLGQSEGNNYLPDDAIAGMTLRKLQHVSDYCSLTSKNGELAWLAGHHYFWATNRSATGVPKDESKEKPKETLTPVELKDAIETEQKAGAWLERHCVAGTLLYYYERRTETWTTLGYCVVNDGAVVNSCILGSGPDDAQCEVLRANERVRELKREKVAEPIAWEWHDERAAPDYCASKCSGKYQVHCDYNDNLIDVTFRVTHGNREIYRWAGYRETVFDIYGDRLYYADFRSCDDCGKTVAVNLASGAKVWDSPMLGVPRRSPFAYGVRMNLEARKDNVVIFARTSDGSCIEIKDAKAGESIGHKIVHEVFPAMKTNGK